MKYLIGIVILAIVLALSMKPTIEQEVEVQVEHSKEMHDSAMQMLIEIHEANDSLLINKYFYGNKDSNTNNTIK